MHYCPECGTKVTIWRDWEPELDTPYEKLLCDCCLEQKIESGEYERRDLKGGESYGTLGKQMAS